MRLSSLVGLATAVTVSSTVLVGPPAAFSAAAAPSVSSVSSVAAAPSDAVPVAPKVVSVPIDLTVAATQSATTDQPADPIPGRPTPVLIQQTGQQPFSVLGFRYDAGGPAPQIEVRVRESGAWSQWQALGVTDAGPDADTAEAARSARQVVTEPLMSSTADAYQVRVTPGVGPLPTGFTAVTIDPGTSPADARMTATAAGPSTSGISLPNPAPAIISRAEWGADETLRTNQTDCELVYNSTVKVGFVHHVASTNNYDEAGAAAEVRGIYAYHVIANGWCDFGYNFVVDKFGRVYEGRWGGVDRPVKGAHTGGFNTDSFGVSALGNYDIAAPSDAMVNAIGRVVGWKLGLHNRNPLGQASLVSAGGGTDKWPVGDTISFNVVSGHRDSGNTVCPGQYLYPKLATIRGIANSVALQTNTTITGASPTIQQVSYAGAPALFTANLPSAQPWELTYVEDVTGAEVRHVSGYAEPGPFPGVWDLTTDSRDWARGGLYTWYLRTPAGGVASGKIEVVPPAERAGADTFTGGITNAGFTPITPVRVYDSRGGSTQPLGPGSSRKVRVVGGSTGVPATGVTGVALNITAVGATRSSYVSVWPAGGDRPPTSSLNLGVGDTVPGLVVAPVGSGGSVILSNDAGSVHLLVDVVGYFSKSGDGLVPVAPVRVLEGSGSPLAGGETRTLDLAGALGLAPAALTGAVVNVTISGATVPGNVLVSPAGTAPDSSTINVVLGRDVTNRSLVATANGKIAVRNTGGTAQVFVDVVGYFSTDGKRYTSVPAARVLDTRYGPGQHSPLAAGETLPVPISALSLPAGATVLATLTSDQATAPSFLTAWPNGQSRPPTSDLNPWPGTAVANTTLFAGGGGQFSNLFNNAGSTHAIVDVVGYFG